MFAMLKSRSCVVWIVVMFMLSHLACRTSARMAPFALSRFQVRYYSASNQSIPVTVAQTPPASTTPINVNDQKIKFDEAIERAAQAKEARDKLLLGAGQYERYSKMWWWENLVICTVFAFTGKSMLHVAKAIMNNIFGLEGSIWKGPNEYRAVYFLISMPVYTTLLITFGFIFRRGPYFLMFARRMWSRFLPDSVLNKVFP